MKLRNKLKISFFILLFSVIFFNIKIFATTGVITEKNVNIREEASTTAKKITQANKDEKVEIIEKNGEWYKVKYNGKTGYIFVQYVKEDTAPIDEIKEEVAEEIETTKNIEISVYIEKGAEIKIIPAIFSNVIYVATEKVNVNILEQLSNWTYISINGINGWIRTDEVIEDSIEITENNNEEEVQEEQVEETVEEEVEEIVKTEAKEETATTQEKKIAYIKYDTVNLRKEANASATILAKLKLNEEVTVLEKTNNVWTKIKYGETIGYVSSELLSDKKQEVSIKQEETTTSRSGEVTAREESTENTITASTSGITGTDIVNYAKQFLGCNYVYGGTSPSGFDCSGLTYYVYKQFGYTLSRTASGQASNGKEVAKADLQPGDLVIFKNNALTKIGHVGIYIGDNKMIHASEPGVGVIITDIDSKSYKYPQRYVTARRIL